ncbi:hypothetical protein LuPra_04938 [Luteitalea pratensis]|uniref:Uncharacterized protein n=1 Tax=Luteitalea pratensis TaxID=1855912 RepID=A0A143PUB0_LUTPR|nr:hypothetical protein LuPra_04938 [Luteitalea pratensis]
MRSGLARRMKVSTRSEGVAQGPFGVLPLDPLALSLLPYP